MEHMKVLKWLDQTYGDRETIADLLGTTRTALYFWAYRKTIPEQFHGKLIAIGVPPELLISGHTYLVKKSISLRKS